jgi:hypothetical protein
MKMSVRRWEVLLGVLVAVALGWIVLVGSAPDFR